MQLSFCVAPLGSYRLAVSTEDLIVILRFLFLYYYYFFFLLDFSKTPGRIFMKFLGMVYIGLGLSRPIYPIPENFMKIRLGVLEKSSKKKKNN